MPVFNRSTISTAVSAILAGAVMSSTPFTVSAQIAGPAPTNTGDVAIAYYAYENGFSTMFNMTNTSDAALAVKVRYREYRNSRDVLDFNVLMSPKDVWTSYISEDAAGNLILVSDDNTCTSPMRVNGRTFADGIPFSTAAITGANDDGGNRNDGIDGPGERMRQGHIEVIVMGECETGDRCFEQATNINEPAGIGWLTKHDESGVPRNCAAADRMFLPTDTWDGNVIPGTGRPLAGQGERFNAQPAVGYSPTDDNIAPLKVNIAYINTAMGTAAGINAFHIEGVTAREDAGVRRNSLLTAQRWPFNLEPTVATAGAGAWDTSEIDLVEDRMTWTNVINEWAVNAATGARTSWVVNFPTKGYHVDQVCNNIYASNNRWRQSGANGGVAPAYQCNQVIGKENLYRTPASGDVNGLRLLTGPGGVTAVTLAPFYEPWLKSEGRSLVPFGFTAWDREEGRLFETEPSPGNLTWAMPWEVTLVSFGSEGGAFGPTPNEYLVDQGFPLGASTGWIDLVFGFDKAGRAMQLPVAGFMLKVRDQGVPGNSYGQAIEHGYIDNL